MKNKLTNKELLKELKKRIKSGEIQTLDTGCTQFCEEYCLKDKKTNFIIELTDIYSDDYWEKVSKGSFCPNCDRPLGNKAFHCSNCGIKF